MTDDGLFHGDIPEVYERLLVPLIFQPYAEDLAGRAERLRPREVLEIASGTGVVTRALAAILPEDVHITATDLSPAMLAVATARQGEDERIIWQLADATSLPFADETFDLVVCQFGMMFLPRKVEAFAGVLKVLRPSGHFLFNVWDSLATNDFARIAHETICAVFPDDPPEFIARLPHGYFDTDAIAGQLGDAGFRDIEIEAIERESVAPYALQAATAYCQGTAMRLEIEARRPGGVAQITEIVAGALAERFGEGPIRGTIRGFVAEARRPG